MAFLKTPNQNMHALFTALVNDSLDHVYVHWRVKVQKYNLYGMQGFITTDTELTNDESSYKVTFKSNAFKKDKDNT